MIYTVIDIFYIWVFVSDTLMIKMTIKITMKKMVMTMKGQSQWWKWWWWRGSSHPSWRPVRSCQEDPIHDGPSFLCHTTNLTLLHRSDENEHENYDQEKEDVKGTEDDEHGGVTHVGLLLLLLLLRITDTQWHVSLKAMSSDVIISVNYGKVPILKFRARLGSLSKFDCSASQKTAQAPKLIKTFE